MGMRSTAFVLLAALSAGASAPAVAADEHEILKGRSIAYVATTKDYAVYVTPKIETGCPNGLNKWGPREQLKDLFPDTGAERTYLDTAMAFEARVWFPNSEKAKAGLPIERYPYYEAVGPVSYGLNLDGKVGPNDFTSPEGEKGIDNQLYRAIGCILWFRAPKTSKYMQDENYHRLVIELTGVDSLTDDDDVTVTTYRGNDPLALDATGNGFLPRATQHIDEARGNMLIHRFHGRIKNGVLETEPNDATLPDMIGGDRGAYVISYRALRWRLALTPEGAQGLAGGYVDIDEFYNFYNRSFPTHYQTYYQLSSPSFYEELKHLADGYPDPKTGANTAISMALNLKMSQVFIIRREKQTASIQAGSTHNR